MNMVSLVAIFGTSLMVGFSGALMPGPVSAAVVSDSAYRGFWAGPLITVGHAIAEFTIVIALAIGLGELLTHHYVRATIGLLGGAFLLWMGYDIAVSAWRGKISLDSVGGQAGGMARLGPIPAGLLTSLANPYWFLWWATVGAGYVLISLQYSLPGLLAFYSGHILSDLTWNSLLAFIFSSGRRVVKDRLYRGILLICGLFLIGLSVYFFVSGVRFLQAV